VNVVNEEQACIENYERSTEHEMAILGIETQDHTYDHGNICQKKRRSEWPTDSVIDGCAHTSLPLNMTDSRMNKFEDSLK
jgi:hypothetical protein